MAQANGAIAAINGTYFSAYVEPPVPYGCIIQDGRLLHISGGAVGAFTEDGRFLVDRIDWEFRGWCNGKWASTPWRMNHPSEEPDSITIFTPEYGSEVTPLPGGKAVLVDAGGNVTDIVTGAFQVPAGGFALSFGPDILTSANNYRIGDKASYTYEIKTTFTRVSDWNDVICAFGAGPSLIINGQITADGQAEGFTEAKIVEYSVPRTFIGATADSKVMFGYTGSVTLHEAADMCRQLGLVNAMCLDAGGSTGLYCEDKIDVGGRDVNNAIGFFRNRPTKKLNVAVGGMEVQWPDVKPFIDENGRTMVPLRAVGTAMGLKVSWDPDLQEAIFFDYAKNTIRFPIGKTEAISTKGTIYMDTAAVIRAGRTFAPIRYLANFFGYGVDWNEATRTVNIR